MSYNRIKFEEHILSLSNNNNHFLVARDEWDLVDTFEAEGYCPCSHVIKQHMVLKNRKNGSVTHVGNCCVRQFMELGPSDEIKALLRLKANSATSPGMKLARHAYARRWISNDECLFLLRMHRSSATVRNKTKRVELNKRIVEHARRGLFADQVQVPVSAGQQVLHDILNRAKAV